MQTLRHPTIIKIQKISGYLLKSITFLRFFFATMGLVIAIALIFMPLGDNSIYDVYAQVDQCKKPNQLHVFDAGISLPFKIFGLLMTAFYSILMMLLLKYARGLLTCFYQGEIFNPSAIFYAKKAFMMNFYIIASSLFFDVCLIVYGLYHSKLKFSPHFLEMTTDIFTAALWLGFLSLGVWALEMGGALKEESELTI